jgi:drug/metabolite transporter (DMT)-like permease
VLLSFSAAVLTIAPSFELSGAVTQASFFALSSAFAYGCYSIYLKVVTKDENRVSMPILFAFVGLYTLLLVVPLSMAAHFCGLVVFDVPTRRAAWSILLNAIVGGLLPNYMWNVAFAFTTPLVVAIGLSFSTPLGLLSSWWLKEAIAIQDYWASVVVILSFVTLNVASLNKKLDAKIDANVIELFKHYILRIKPVEKESDDVEASNVEASNVEADDIKADDVEMKPCQVKEVKKPCCRTCKT